MSTNCCDGCLVSVYRWRHDARTWQLRKSNLIEVFTTQVNLIEHNGRLVTVYRWRADTLKKLPMKHLVSLLKSLNNVQEPDVSTKCNCL